jgi:hypothetical protein
MGKIRITKFGILLVFLVLIIGTSCTQRGNRGANELVKGTNGLTINFLDYNPQENYLISEEGEPISIIVDVRNQGTYPQDDELNILSRGQVYISGFDDTILIMEEKSKRLNRDFLPGVSSINPEGSFDTLEFKGDIYSDNIIVDKYEPNILATICYPYITRASPSACIDPFPFDEKQRKVCNIGPQTLSSQGAPIAITRIDQEASTSKMQFKISIKNVGGGDVVKISSLEKCNPYESNGLEREDFDRVELLRATAGQIELSCGPFDKGGNRIIRLFNGEGFVICSMLKSEYTDARSAYTTPLNIELRYGYRSTISKKIKISKVTTIN